MFKCPPRRTLTAFTPRLLPVVMRGSRSNHSGGSITCFRLAVYGAPQSQEIGQNRTASSDQAIMGTPLACNPCSYARSAGQTRSHASEDSAARRSHHRTDVVGTDHVEFVEREELEPSTPALSAPFSDASSGLIQQLSPLSLVAFGTTNLNLGHLIPANFPNDIEIERRIATTVKLSVIERQTLPGRQRWI
jgi:hypothetical protein